MIHLRVVSPPGITAALVPMLATGPAVLNLTVLANEVIGRLRDLGLQQRGSIVLENVDTSPG